MTRARHAADRDLHERFSAWLLQGAADEPARDLALHGAFCPDCRADLAALDLLPLIDTGRAPMPPSRPSARPTTEMPIRPRLAWAAAASLVVVAAGGWALGFGRLPGSSASPSPAQQVLGGFGGGVLASPTPLPPGSSVAPPGATASEGDPEATPAPSLPGASPAVSSEPQTAAPTSAETAEPTRSSRATSSPKPSLTPAPTATPTPSPTPTPAPPLAQCADGLDNDGDTLIDLADPGCIDALDNDETDPP